MAETLISRSIQSIRADLPEGVTLVCVSKFHPVEAVREAYNAGERHFGESRVQELQHKAAALPADICWHFIGHLQTNKVRDLLRIHPYLIESVDSLRLLNALQKEAATMGITQDILLELHVAREETKTGFTPEELKELMAYITTADGQRQWPNIHIRGVMTMATNTDDETEIKRCFDEAKALYDQFTNHHSPLILSMGMSDDYRLAVACGSTSVRIGSAIFGARTLARSPQAIFFDMDGTLFNSMPFHARAWEDTMRAHGLDFDAQDTYINEGRTGESVIHEAFEQKGLTGTPEQIASIYREKTEAFHRMCPNGADPVPGVPELLCWLRDNGIQCWIVTGSGQKTLLAQLDRSFPGIFTPERMITAFDVTHGKPDPEPYLKAWERSGLPKEACWVVENAPLGVRSGKAAGLYTIAVNTGPLPDRLLLDEHADLVFADMLSLFHWLKANKKD